MCVPDVLCIFWFLFIYLGSSLLIWKLCLLPPSPPVLWQRNTRMACFGFQTCTLKKHHGPGLTFPWPTRAYHLKIKRFFLFVVYLMNIQEGHLGICKKKISVEDRVCNEKESRSTLGENERTSLCKSAFACMTLANVLPLAAGHKGFQSDCNCDG